MISRKLFFVFVACAAYYLFVVELRLHPNTGLNTIELLEKHNYKYENHSVITEDGYILEMHRVVPKKLDATKKPIFIMHGATGNSATWMLQGPDKSLVCMLSDLGYDVWLGNNRGNEWAEKHQTLDRYKDEEQFFDFSWDEIGRYDLSATIDYILNKTKQRQLIYVGYSSGATALFVLLSERPEYNNKITFASGLGPLAYMSNVPSTLLQIYANYRTQFNKWFIAAGIHEFPPKIPFLFEMSKRLCHDNTITQPLCAYMLFIVDGFDYDQFNGSLVPAVARHLPLGSSLKLFTHYAQGVTTGEFRQFDYGVEKNSKMYGKEIPPSYDLSKITVPIALFYGENDAFSGAKDVEYLARKIKDVKLYKNRHKNFNHLDFLWSHDVVELLYNDVVAEIKKY